MIFSKHIVQKYLIPLIVNYTFGMAVNNGLFQNVVVEEHCEYLVHELTIIHSNETFITK
jgi:hypothetical protein